MSWTALRSCGSALSRSRSEGCCGRSRIPMDSSRPLKLLNRSRKIAARRPVWMSSCRSIMNCISNDPRTKRGSIATSTGGAFSPCSTWPARVTVVGHANDGFPDIGSGHFTPADGRTIVDELDSGLGGWRCHGHYGCSCGVRTGTGPFATQDRSTVTSMTRHSIFTVSYSAAWPKQRASSPPMPRNEGSQPTNLFLVREHVGRCHPHGMEAFGSSLVEDRSRVMGRGAESLFPHSVMLQSPLSS